MIVLVNGYQGYETKSFFTDFIIIIRRDIRGTSQRIEGICHNSYI